MTSRMEAINVFKTNALLATPMIIVIDVVVDIMFAIKAKKEDKGL